jgi:hypothetical protein
MRFYHLSMKADALFCSVSYAADVDGNEVARFGLHPVQRRTRRFNRCSRLLWWLNFARLDRRVLRKELHGRASYQRAVFC